MVIAVSYHETVTKLQGLSQCATGPFDRHNWYQLLEEYGCKPLIVVADNGENKAALALMQANGRIESLRNWFSFSWRPLAPEGDEGDALLRAIARDIKRREHRLELLPLPEEDGSAARLQRIFECAGWFTSLEQCDENHVLAVNGRSFAEYWATRPGKMRTTLKRKAKKVDVEILDRFDADAWNAYRAVYAESWKPGEEQADLLEAFARAETAGGRLRLGLAHCEGVPVAAQFWTVEGTTAYIHKLAHIEAAKPLSAGTTLSAALFERVIDTDGVEVIDFGTGSDTYKRDWMELIRPRYRLSCFNPRKARAWPGLAKAALHRLAPAQRRG